MNVETQDSRVRLNFLQLESKRNLVFGERCFEERLLGRLGFKKANFHNLPSVPSELGNCGRRPPVRRTVVRHSTSEDESEVCA
jgi:hypothetical protein